MEGRNLEGDMEEDKNDEEGEGKGIFDNFEYDIERSKRLTSSLPPPESQIDLKLEKKYAGTFSENKGTVSGINTLKKNESGLGALKGVKATENLLNKKYTVFWVVKTNEDVLEIIMELSQQCTVSDLIASSIPFFNKTLQDMGIQINLPLDIEKYLLYTARKSGHPKLDYPPLDSGQLLTQTGVQSFAIIFKPNSSSAEKKRKSDILSPSTGMTLPIVTGLNLNNESDSDQKMNSGEDNSEYYCFCIPKSNPKSKKELKKPLLKK